MLKLTANMVSFVALLLTTSCQDPNTGPTGHSDWKYESVHFDIVMNVDTPAGEKTASSDIDIERGTGKPHGLDCQGAHYFCATDRSLTIDAEAIPVALGNGKTLVLLLSDTSGNWVAHQAFDIDKAIINEYTEGKGDGGINLFVDKDCSGDCNVASEIELPVIGYFDDPGKPATFHEIGAGDLSGAIGKGYSIKSIRAQHDPTGPHHGVAASFPWVNQLKTIDKGEMSDFSWRKMLPLSRLSYSQNAPVRGGVCKPGTDMRAECLSR